MDLNNKIIVLTGATGGIGQAMAAALDKQGAQLILTARNQDKLSALNKALGNKHREVATDISTEQGREELLSACRANGVDILINNAGSSECAPLQTIPAARIEQMINLNLTTPMLLSQALLPLLKQRPCAAIVNVGSTFGSIGYPGFSTYCATKFGLRGFTESLRRELAGSAVKVMYLAPRATKTALNSEHVVAMNNALGNAMDSPERVAEELITLLQSTKLKERYIGWPEKLFVKINGVFPSLVDGSLKKQLPTIKRFFEQQA